MKKVLLPVIAGVTMASMALAQQATPKLDTRPDVQVHKFEMFCGPSSYLGVFPADVTEENAKSLGMSETYGALLNDVVENSPARAAGLQKNDIVISWNGTRVESAAALRRMVVETPEGRSVRIGYIRGGVRGEIDAKIGKRPAPEMGMGMGLGMGQGQGDFDLVMPKEGMEGLGRHIEQIFMKANDPRTGMTLQTVTPQLAKYFGLGDGSGALIGSVAENSSSAKAGLQAGDVVVAIDGKKVTTPMDAHKIIGPKKEGTVDVTVMRDKKEQTFTVKLEGKPFDMNFPGFEGLEDMHGPIELFQSLPNGGGDIEIVTPKDGADPDLSEMDTPNSPNAQVRTHIRVMPRVERQVIKDEAPPAGM